MTINPITHRLTGYATNDDVVRRRWLVLDFDVQGKGDGSSTDDIGGVPIAHRPAINR